jgi:hypothetical protein
MRALLICLALVTGCRSFEVRAFDVPVSQEARLIAASDDSEFTPLAVVVGVVIVAGLVVLFLNYGSSEE